MRDPQNPWWQPKFVNDEGFQDQRENQPFIMDDKTLEVLYLQTIPSEIEVGPDMSWVAVAASGRNVPLYQYTGAEDTIKFTVTFYSNRIDGKDVWRKIKWLQSFKNDGYKDPVHLVRFVFGELFRKSKFVLYATPARISNFHRDKGMMPALASIDIELKRVSEFNQLRSEMLDLNY